MVDGTQSSGIVLGTASLRAFGVTPGVVTAASRDIVTLTKPRITAMAVIVAAGALLLAPGTIAPLQGALVLVAIAMAVAGAGALNMLIERDVDCLMERTATRPLATRRLGPAVGLVVGGGLSGLALPLLYLAGGPLSAALTAFSLFVYVLVYTPMKRTSPWALVVGAVPGAMPALMGSSAVSGRFDLVGLGLFLFVFLWQLPHFLAIAIYREREYTAAGHRIVPAVWGMRAAKLLMAGTALALAASGVALWPMGIAGPSVGIVAAISGAAFVALCAQGLSRRVTTRADEDAWARRVFIASLIYQTVLFAALAGERVIVGLLS